MLKLMTLPRSPSTCLSHPLIQASTQASPSGSTGMQRGQGQSTWITLLVCRAVQEPLGMSMEYYCAEKLFSFVEQSLYVHSADVIPCTPCFDCKLIDVWMLNLPNLSIKKDWNYQQRPSGSMHWQTMSWSTNLRLRPGSCGSLRESMPGWLLMLNSRQPPQTCMT